MAEGFRLSLFIFLLLFINAYSRGGFRGGGRGFSAGRGIGRGRGSFSGRGGGGGYYSGTSYNSYGVPPVRSTSFSRYNGGYSTVHIVYFRGSGSGMKSVQPTVTGSVIFNSIFSNSASIVTPWAYKRTPYVSSSSPFPMKVIDPTRPFTIVSTSLYYFWGNSSLPLNNDSLECFDYTTTNDFKNISLCDVQSMDRCAANISDLTHFSSYSFFSSQGKRLDQFAWMCKKDQVCCQWECCDPHRNTSSLGLLVMLAVVVSFFGCCIGCYLLEYCCNQMKKQQAIPTQNTV